MSGPVAYGVPKPSSNGGAGVSNGNGKFQWGTPLLAAAFEFGGERHAMISRENVTLRKMNEDELRAALEAAEAALREAEQHVQAAERRRRIAEAVADLRAIASSELRLEDVLQGIVERVAEVLGVQAAAVYSAEERWDHLALVAGCGALPSRSRKAKGPVAPRILAAAIADGRGVAVNDAWQDVPLSPAEAGPALGRAHHRALLLAPIERKDKLYGYLALFYAKPQEFSADDVALAHLFGAQVALALENVELRSQAEKTAIENERNRLARELHDAVTQTLFSASVMAEALPRVLERDPEEGRRALEELRLWTRGALAEMRTLLMELRPTALVEKPLPDLIRQLGEAASTRLCIPAVCEIDAEAEPSDEVKLCLYRIAQEALNNMAKHSNASRVEIDYQASTKAVRLAIVDNGCGFDPAQPFPGQMGLRIMAERAQHIGARLSIDSAPGVGTEVRVEWRPRGRKKWHE